MLNSSDSSQPSLRKANSFDSWTIVDPPYEALPVGSCGPSQDRHGEDSLPCSMPVLKVLQSPDFQDVVVQRLSKAVKIPTVVGDDMGLVGEDPQWKVFYGFTAFLENAFPML